MQRTGIRQRHIAGDGETTSTLATRAAEAALADAGLTPADIDLIIVATSTPDYTFPGGGDPDAGRARDRPRRRLRSAGGLLGLRVRRRDGRQVPRLRLAQARAGDRRRDVLAPARLDRPHDLRAVRRRRGGDRAGGGAERRQADLARRHLRRSCAPTAAIAPSSMSTAARRRPRRSAICAWKARRCSSTRSAW